MRIHFLQVLFVSFLFFNPLLSSHAVQSDPFDISAGIQLPGPPAVGSAEDQADYQAMLQIQNTRTRADCTRAGSEVSISLASFYGAPYGPLTDAEVKKLSTSYALTLANVYAPIAIAKKKYQRLRPYNGHADIVPCIQKEGSFSYPSGHSAISEVFFRMLVEQFPDRRAALEARQAQIEQDRVVGGVHYPTDVHDGKLLGDQIFEQFIKR